MLQSFQNCFKIPELRTRILFTLGLLIVYRIGGQITVPGVEVRVVQEFFSNSGNTLFGLYDMFVGGAFTRATIFALGIMPYISASIILQLLGAVIPFFQKLQREGEEGKKRLTHLVWADNIYFFAHHEEAIKDMFVDFTEQLHARELDWKEGSLEYLIQEGRKRKWGMQDLD